MKYFVFAACVITFYCVGAAHDDCPSSGQQLIKLIKSDETMPGCHIACIQFDNSSVRLLAVAVCHANKQFAQSASRAAVRSMHSAPVPSVAELWQKIKFFYKKTPSKQDVTNTYFVATFQFNRTMNWRSLYADEPTYRASVRGQLFFPDKGHTVAFEEKFDASLRVRFKSIDDKKPFFIDIDHDVFEALDHQNAATESGCEIL